MNKTISIGDFTPNTKGPLFRFEVVQVYSNPDLPDQVSCKIVDETGCIDAFFNNYGKFIKVGSVYEVSNFKCSVVEHSLRVQLTKDSKITKIKHEMGFRDLSNNLSQRFYVTKEEDKLITEQINRQTAHLKSQTSPSQQKKQKEQQIHSNLTSTKNEKQSHEIKIHQQKPIKVEKKSNYGRKPILYQQEPEAKKVQKKKYVEKKKALVENNQFKYDDKGSTQFQQRIKLQKMYLFREREINLIVKVLVDTTIDHHNYQLIKVCDASGSAYIEFDSHLQLENKSWYILSKFQIFKDKIYGYIASQTKQSTIQLANQFDERVNMKPIHFPKNQ